jgi:hypothetical protein
MVLSFDADPTEQLLLAETTTTPLALAVDEGSHSIFFQHAIPFFGGFARLIRGGFRVSLRFVWRCFDVPRV